MTSSTSFSCYVIGSTSLPIHCTEILLREGHEVRGIITADAAFSAWAGSRGIHVLSPDSTLKSKLASEAFDYLFSIVNEHILDDAILAMPRKLAINYHDAPLPRYAGTHATSWALLAREPHHGISWHVASKQVDAGDLLAWKHFPIDPGETAFSLNTKCYEAAGTAFGELVERLAIGQNVRTAQDLGERTFFPRWKRLPGAALLSWQRSAEEIAAVVRALDFGPHNNPLGVAKFVVGRDGADVVAALEVEVLSNRSGLPPGTVVSTSDSAIVVATATVDLAVSKLSSVDGRPLTVPELTKTFGISSGACLPDLSAGTVAAIDRATQATARNENYWVDSLLRYEPLSIPYALPAGSIDRIPVFARAEMATPSACFGPVASTSSVAELLVVAWVAYLGRLAGTSSFDVGFASPTLADTTAGAERFFATCVPLHCAFNDTDAFETIASSTLAQMREATKRVTYPYDVALRYPALRLAEGPVQVARVNACICTSPGAAVPPPGTEIMLAVATDGSHVVWIHDGALYSTERVARMKEQFRCFLDGLSAAPERGVCLQPLMSELERRKIVVDWNATELEPFDQCCLHELFERQVERTPDAEALVWLSERLSYRELELRANRLARYLQRLGVTRDSRVGLCVERSLDMVVAMLAILKAGGAYVPLDPAYPVDRLRFILEDAKAPVLVTQQRLRALLADTLGGCKTVCMDSDADVIRRESGERPSRTSAPDSLAYIIYTSGSTGRPKGVAIEHHSPVTLVMWARTLLHDDETRAVSLVTSVCFDLSIWETFVPLSRGGKIVLAENALHVADLPARNEITLINTVPSAIRELVRQGSVPPSVRVVCLAGEPLTVELVNAIYAVPTVEKVYDLYGPSETTTYSTCALRRPHAPYTVGRPIGNTQIYILDRHDQPVPVGLPGQLHIAGDGVARGYHERPDLTAEKFVDGPFGNQRGARMYRTGDLARFYENGDIELLGRMDHQVKVRGFRIELGEIEAVLRTSPGVVGAVAVVLDDPSGDKRLIAYVAGNASEIPDNEELRTRLKQKVPDYMVPSTFVRLPELPLNPSGKIDRKALPKPDLAAVESANEFVAPRDEIEEKLAAIWREVLMIERIGIDDDYFALGGDSLRAIRLFARIQDTFGKRLGLATLFSAPTIAQLAKLLRAADEAPAWSAIVPIQPRGKKPPFFCIHARGGNVLFYRDLARRLGEDQPFYGIQPQGIDGKQPYLTSIPEMAALYIRELRKIQPKGPYYLGGSSFGGTAAFEMAHQLLAMGEEVAVLAVFDTGGPGYPKRIPVGRISKIVRELRHLEQRAASQVWTLRNLDADKRVDYVRAKTRKLEVKYKRKLRMELIRVAKKLPTRISERFMPSYVNARWALLEFEKSIKQALSTYVHHVYPGTMLLFRATKQPVGIYPDPMLGWGDLVAGKLEVFDVEGNHGSIVVEPSVRSLAVILESCLEEARSRRQGRDKATSLATSVA